MNTALVTLNGITGQQIVTTKGKTVGIKMSLGKLTASEVREAGRALGLKGDKLTAYVNKALSDEGAQREAKLAVSLVALKEAGYVSDEVVARTKSATIKFVKPGELKSKSAKAKSLIEKMDEVERAEVLALLKSMAAEPVAA